MTSLFFILLVSTLTLTACRWSGAIPYDPPPQPTPVPTKNKPVVRLKELYLEPRDLIKSTSSNKQLNEVTLNDFPSRTEKVFVSIPFYFNSENYTKVMVRKPTVTAEGCSSSEIELPLSPFSEYMDPDPSIGGPWPMYTLGWSRGQVPKKPLASMSYDIEESDSKANSDQTFTIQFTLPPTCTRVDFSFEAYFE